MRKGAPVGVLASLAASAPAANALKEPIDSNVGSARQAPRPRRKWRRGRLARGSEARVWFLCMGFISLVLLFLMVLRRPALKGIFAAFVNGRGRGYPLPGGSIG